MDDLRDRLHQVESNPLPDVWGDVLARATRHEMEPRASVKRRLLVGTVALLIAAVAFAVSLPALRGHGSAGTGIAPGSQSDAAQITIGGTDDSTATLSAGGTSVAGVPVNVIIDGRADGVVTHGPIYKGSIAGTLQMNSFHIDYAAVAEPDLSAILVASDMSIASDPADTVIFAFAPPDGQTGASVQWSPTGEGRMIPLQLPSSFQHLSEGPWRLVVVGRGSGGNLFQFAFQVDVQPAGSSVEPTAGPALAEKLGLQQLSRSAYGEINQDGCKGGVVTFDGQDGPVYCLDAALDFNSPTLAIDKVVLFRQLAGEPPLTGDEIQRLQDMQAGGGGESTSPSP